VEQIPVQVDASKLLLAHLDPFRIFAGIQLALHAKAGSGGDGAIRLTMTSWLTSGLPRQFFVMKEYRRCSILFHLLVPGGKWQTEISSLVSSASFCSSTFHNRTRDPLLPPLSAVIKS